MASTVGVVRVFVTGATGAIGGHVVPALLHAGHEVTALARSPEKAVALEERGATPVEVSLFDDAGLTEAFAGHDAVANLATAIPATKDVLRTKAWAENNRIRRDGSTALVDAALAAGVGRVVQESICFLYPDRGEAWIDEDVAPDVFPIAEANLAAEANAQRFTAAGGAGVVLRFGFFYGPGAGHSDEMIGYAGHHIATVMGRADGYVSSIHLADAAAAVVAALGVEAGTYNVVDDEPMTKRANAEALAAAVGTKAWITIPGRLALLFGDRTTSLTRSLRVSNARFREASGWAPRYPSVREGWPATVAERT